MNVKALQSFETSVTIFQSTGHDIAQDLNRLLYSQCPIATVPVLTLTRTRIHNLIFFPLTITTIGSEHVKLVKISSAFWSSV